MRLKNKVSIITGGSSGMGRSTAELFSKEGSTTIISGRRTKNGENVASRIRKNGGDAIFIKADISKNDEVKHLVNETIEKYGRIDILFNNAGINNHGLGNPHEEDEKVFDEVIAINLKGAFMCIKHVIPHMINNGGGSIINNSSVLDTRANDSSSTSYHVSKGGMNMLTKKSALAYAKYNIRVNSIQPGAIATEMSGVIWEDLNDNSINFERSTMQPLNRMGHPNDIAYAALFFASSESAFITGASLVVDGGASVAHKWVP